jgi:RNA recognition motif-containing protein
MKDDEVKNDGLQGQNVKEEEEDAVTSSKTEDVATSQQQSSVATEPSAPSTKNEDEEEDLSDKKRRVYVGNLAWEVSWQDLKDLMKTLNHEVVRVDVMQTSEGRSKGCGIVEFATPEGAAEAVLTLNDTELSGRRIFVREDRENSNSVISGRDNPSRGGRYNNQRNRHQGNLTVSSVPESQPRRVYVGNLSWDVTWSDLKDHMRTAGDVKRADVICEHNGRSKGCGIVEFETEEGAQKAIETLTHTELLGRTIFVREDREGSGSEGKGGHRPRHVGAYSMNPNQTSNNCSVYVWNLSYDVSWQDLKDHMRKAGNVDQATILTGNDGSTSIGCGIVVYQSTRDAERAIRELQESDLKGRPMRLREDKVASTGSRSDRGGRGGQGGGHGGGRGYSDEPASKGTQLYVGNLSYDTTWGVLKDHFNQAGEVVRADVKSSENGRSKGFGIVRFARPKDAEAAISTLSGVELDGRALEVRPDHKA